MAEVLERGRPGEGHDGLMLQQLVLKDTISLTHAKVVLTMQT